MKNTFFILLIAALVTAGCKQELKKEDIQQGVTEMFQHVKTDGIDKALAVFADGYDQMNDSEKQRLRDAFSGKEFKIVKIEGDKVTVEIDISPADGGQIIVKTVIFKVIQVDGKIRVKDIVNVIEHNGTPREAGIEDASGEGVDSLEASGNALSEEHD